MKTSIYSFVLLLFFNCSYCQTSFTKSYNDVSSYNLTGDVKNIIATHDSGFVFTSTTSDGFDYSESNITKIDKNGNIIWTNLYEQWTPQDQNFIESPAFIDTINNEKIIGLKVFAQVFLYPLISVIDINTGIADTSRIIGIGATCPITDLDLGGYTPLDIKTINQNTSFILARSLFYECSGSSALLRYENNNIISWAKIYGGFLEKIFLANDTIIGYGYNNICAYDLTGNLLWSKKWSLGSIYIKSMTLEENGKFLVAGYLNPDTASFIAEISNNGEVSWFKKYKGNLRLDFRDIEKLDNNFYAVGSIKNSANRDSAACIVKLNSIGEIQNSYLSKTGLKKVNCVTKTFDNNLIIGGSNSAYFVDDEKPIICKFFPNGSDSCWSNYNLSSQNISIELIPDNKTNVAVGHSATPTYIATNQTSHNESVLCSSITVTTCEPPQYQYANNISNTGAAISWSSSSNAVKYRLQVRKTGTSTWTQYILSGNSYNLNSLLPNTAYQYRVRSVCSSNGSVLSPWCSIKTFTTTNVNSGCVTPQNIAVTNNGNSSAAISWAAQTGIVNYQLRVRAVGTSTWTVYVIAGSLNSKTITALVPNTAYQFQIRTQCTTGSFTPFTSLQTFNTPLRLEEEVATQELESLLIYPNPSKDFVNIITNCNSCKLRVFDLQGRIILERNPDADNFSINISDWASGIYLIEVENENEIQRVKLVKE